MNDITMDAVKTVTMTSKDKKEIDFKRYAKKKYGPNELPNEAGRTVFDFILE